MATASRMTAEEYYAVTVEGDRTQLVDGVIVVNEPKAIHAVLQVRLCTALQTWAEAAEGRGMVLLPTDVAIDEHNVYGPDLMWFSEERRMRDLDAYPDRVPDLCVEIRSDSTWRCDVEAKRAGYERAGLPELWLVNHVIRRVLALRRSRPDAHGFDAAIELGRGDDLTSPQLPGFALPLNRLFRD